MPRLGNLACVPVPRIFIAIACLLALSACSAPANPTSTASPAAPVWTNLNGITVAGKFGVKPKVTFKAPFTIDKTQDKVVIAGTGVPVQANGLLTCHYALYSARTGKLLQESFSTTGAAPTFAVSNVAKGFASSLTGKPVGSRVVMAVTGADGFDGLDANYQPEGYKNGDTSVFVVDILGASLAQPSGTVVPSAAGMPKVVGDAAAKPVVMIPNAKAPTQMSSQAIIQGSGKTVAAQDIVYARYVGYSWQTGELIDDKFSSPNETALSASLVGMRAGLLGKRVGSRVLLVLPPAYSYPLGSNRPPVTKGDTVVYVVDILYAYAGA